MVAAMEYEYEISADPPCATLLNWEPGNHLFAVDHTVPSIPSTINNQSTPIEIELIGDLSKSPSAIPNNPNAIAEIYTLIVV